jgi:phosphonate transport system substrate-binding protein
LYMLYKNGLNPAKDVYTINTTTQIGWESLRRNRVLVLGMRVDEYKKLLSLENQAYKNQIAVLYSGDDLPSDLIIASPNVKYSIVKKIRDVFISNNKQFIAAILLGDDNKKYVNSIISEYVDDRSYDYIEDMAKVMGYEKILR